MTGEVHKKPSGKIYVYYHCAHRKCPEKRKHVEQAVILNAIKKAFAPFARISKEDVQTFVQTIEEKLLDIDSYSQIKTKELSYDRRELKREILELEVLRQLILNKQAGMGKWALKLFTSSPIW